MFALTWEDIDFENNIIRVKHSIYDKPKDIKGRWYIGTTKTINGKRNIYISKTLKTALENYKRKQDYLKKIYGKRYKYYHIEEVTNDYGKVKEFRIVINSKNKKYENVNLIFTREDGSYLGTDITKYPFKIIHEQLGIKKYRFYDLRGSYATKILRNGADLKEVADLMGHKNIETTENYYISSTDETRKEAVDKFDDYISSDIIKSISKFE